MSRGRTGRARSAQGRARSGSAQGARSGSAQGRARSGALAWLTARGWLIPLLVGTAVLSVFLGARLNAWVDEIFSLDTTAQALPGVLRRALYVELQPPAYFVLLKLWRTLDSSLLFSRVLSTCFVLLTLWVVARLARLYLEEVHPVWLVLPLSCHPYLIYAATEARCYALALLISALLLHTFHQGYFAEESSRRARIAHGLLSILALYTQYFLGFILVAGGAALLVARRWPSLKRYLLAMLIVGLSLIPLCWVLPRQIESHTGAGGPVALGAAVQLLYWRVLGYLLPLKIAAPSAVLLWSYRIALVLLVVGLYRRRAQLTGTGVSLAVSALTLLLSYFLLLRLLDPEILGQRHTAFLFVQILLCTFFVVGVVFGRKVVIGLALLQLAMNAAELVRYYRPMAKPGDWARVATHIAEREQQDQPILIFSRTAALPFRYYYRGKNQVLAIPRESSFERWDPSGDVLKSEQEIDAVLSRASLRAKGYWLVRNQTGTSLGHDFHVEILDRYVSRRFTVAQSHEFHATEVSLLEPKRAEQAPRR